VGIWEILASITEVVLVVMIILLYLKPPSDIGAHLVTVGTIWMLSQVDLH
jgi:hypothetical protein